MIKRFNIIVILFLLVSFIRAKPDQIMVPLTLPGEPGKLNIEHVKGGIKVTGYEGDVVIIRARLRNSKSENEQNGLARVLEQSIQLNATEKDNQVQVFSNSQVKTIDLDINVPRNFDLNINNIEDGIIEIINVDGELVLNNAADDVIINNVYGPAVISTIDGKIEARFREVPPEQPMAFSTVSGKIEVRLPADTRAILKMRTDFGEIYTDFKIDVEPRKTLIEKSEKTGASKFLLDEWTYARINGGGTQILFKSYHGDIFIQRANVGD
jgi:hypothetical protein